MIAPMEESLFEEMQAICKISSGVLIGLAILFKASSITFTAFSTPFLMSIGFAPAEMFLTPSLKMLSARTIAVVVPSPATSDALEEASLMSWAPMFSYLSFRFTSFATVTPSFVDRGDPYSLAMTTFLPLGPSVTMTAFARVFTPLRMDFKASS